MPTSAPAVDNDRGVELSNLGERGNNVAVASVIRNVVRAVVREEMLTAAFTSASTPTQASSQVDVLTSAPEAPPPSYDTATRTSVLRANLPSAPRSEGPRPLASGTPQQPLASGTPSGLWPAGPPAASGQRNPPAAGFPTSQA
ncbi:hypothetical protein B0T17DRAFT_615248 [Bombardia bombarda]|uniref:Uncharacterized protein n=1 Tax=Bombardia bombarda TaxID=252184 RepID=A0AA40C8V0_9PEZI|nr:hypothetical protein B0T17DRAFT_615248 [Bombardia bombarda]